jgi:hypothetical protein
LSWHGGGIHLVEMMPGLFAAIIESAWRGLVKLRRDFSGLYVLWGDLQLKGGCKALTTTLPLISFFMRLTLSFQRTKPKNTPPKPNRISDEGSGIAVALMAS